MAPFAIVPAAAAWIVTSSPRFACFGRQMALAYSLTMFQTWRVNLSLAASRDRLMRHLLGLFAMGLIFDVAGAQPRLEGEVS